MQLYGTLTSPYVRKVRIFAQEKQLPLDFIAEAPRDPAGNVPSLNPLGKIPVLRRDDGTALFDSVVIIEFLDSLARPALLPADGETRWTVQRWHALAQGILDATVARLTETRRPPEKQMPEALTKQETKIAASLKFAAQHLAPGPWLAGQTLTLADIAMGTALAYVDFRYSNAWRQTYPPLAAWAQNIASRPSFQLTAPLA